MNSTPQADFHLSEVGIPDAKDIAQYVEVPAMQNGPLFRTMFSQFNTIAEAQKEQITCWYTEILEDAFQNQQERFLKACSSDGTPVGFCGWTVIERNYDGQVEANNSQVDTNNGQADKPIKREKAQRSFWVPEAIDIDGWTLCQRL
jgi:hypothetical protein